MSLLILIEDQNVNDTFLKTVIPGLPMMLFGVPGVVID